MITPTSLSQRMQVLIEKGEKDDKAEEYQDQAESCAKELKPFVVGVALLEAPLPDQPKAIDADYEVKGG